MTAKRGTQWKTSWRRQKPSIGTTPQDMWWFANFGDGLAGESFFQQALTTPAIGDVAPPFWVGAVFGSSVPGSFLDTLISRGVGAPFPSTPSWRTRLEWDSAQVILQARADARSTVPPNPFVDQSLTTLNASVSPPLIRAVVQMLVVEDVPSGLQVSLWIDGALRGVDISPAGTYVPSIGEVFVQPKLGFLNSMAGGNALPSTQEIQDWFSATRYALPFPSAQPIPGKTLDQYDAANTPGVVPNPLVNLSGGQAAPLVSTGAPPVAVNILVATTFGY